MPAITICDEDKTFSDNWALSEIFFNFFLLGQYNILQLNLVGNLDPNNYLNKDFKSLLPQLFEKVSNWVDNVVKKYPDILDIIYNEDDELEVVLLRDLLEERKYSSSFNDFEDFLRNSVGNFKHSTNLCEKISGKESNFGSIWDYMPKSSKFAVNGCRGNCTNLNDKIKKLLLKSLFLGFYQVPFGNIFRNLAPKAKTFKIYSSLFVSKPQNSKKQLFIL